MSRTYRRNQQDYDQHRRPRTRSERRQNLAIAADQQWEYDQPIEPANRRNRFISSDYDNLQFS